MDLKSLIEEIESGVKELEETNYNSYNMSKGKGSKAYVIRRIDIVRDELLRIKKEINEK